jgi:hypothetical protein
MTIIEDIDVRKPLAFYGACTTISDDPVLVNMAAKHNNPRLRLVTSPVTGEIALSPDDARVLLAYLEGCCWRDDFDENLQCISETKAGEALLTGWMSIETFTSFVSDAAPNDLDVRKILDGMKSATSGWTTAGVQEVYFDGYSINQARG